MKRIVCAAFALVLVACASGGPSEPRETYNRALGALGSGDFERASELLLEARDRAGSDGELRYRAAYNLGLAHAGSAEAAAEEDPEAALEALRTSAAWFRDAVRLRPEDEDARANLELVLRRAQVLADRINQGQNGLEPRLERLIGEQRGLRDDLRALVEEIEEAGASAEPAAFEPAFEALATAARTLFAETGTISDLAADELAPLSEKAPEELTQEEAVRRAQLAAVDAYLQDARFAQDELRRALRRLDGGAAHDRASAALDRLKRAREQLLDPVAVLQAAAQEQVLVRQHTALLEAAGQGDVSLDGEGDAAGAAPSWLTAAHLAARERAILERTGEIAARFRAATESDASAAPAEDDQEAARMLAAAAEALPSLEDAVGAMQAAAAALDAELLGAAGERETEALAALAAAIERFSGLRALIELAYRDQSAVVALLDPERADPDLSTAERADAIAEALAANADRLARMEALLEIERSKAAEEAAAAEADEAAAFARFDAAEGHRAAALEAVEALASLTARARRGGAAGGDALELARRGQAELEELRRLFFSIVEHLKDLHRRQGETHDRSAAAQAAVGDDVLAELGPATDAQSEHAALASALAEALAAQADEAGQSDDPQAASQAETLAAAAEEVRAAAAAMQSAADTMREAREQASRMSVDLSPALEEQPRALLHVEEAIRILEPPQQDPQQQQDQEQQPDPQQQQDQVSREQAQRRLQAIREREAQRRRDRQQAPAPQPVEKDW